MLNCKSDEIIPKNLATVLLSVEQNLVAQSVQNPPAIRETQVRSVGGEDPLEKETATHSSILSWKIPWTEELAGCSPWGRKEADTTEQVHHHHSSFSWHEVNKSKPCST